MATNQERWTYNWTEADTEFEVFIQRLVREELDLDLTEEDYAKHWLNIFIGQGYDAGLRTARKTTKKLFQAATILPEGAALRNPAHQARAQSLYHKSLYRP